MRQGRPGGDIATHNAVDRGAFRSRGSLDGLGDSVAGVAIGAYTAREDRDRAKPDDGGARVEHQGHAGLVQAGQADVDQRDRDGSASERGWASPAGSRDRGATQQRHGT